MADLKRAKKSMGVETDYLLASPSQSERVLASFDPAKDFSGVYGKGTDPISLGALLGVFTGEGYRDGLIDEFQLVASAHEGEKIICRVSNRLRQYLEAMDPASIPGIVASWLATEEFQLTGWDEKIATEFITGLKTLLTREDAKAKEFWMVIST